jgi:undecaprenyl-diphosphatase
VSALQSLFLGLLQGLTEFLPVSSSGHLALAENVLGLHGEDLAFVVFVHFGTMMATVTVFWREIWQMITAGGGFIAGRRTQPDPHLRLLGMILLGTVPAAVLGLLFEKSVETVFSNIVFVSAMLLITGLILWLTRYVPSGNKQVGFREAVIVGCAQALAILPGISRSGATISTALYGRVEKAAAVKFSFLLALPAIMGATLLKAVDVIKSPPPTGALFSLFLGTLAAYLSGYAAIKLLLQVVGRGKLTYFSFYCWAVGILSIIRTLG